MLSKETRLRRLINRVWRTTNRKTTREAGVQKDGYRWIVHNALRFGMDPFQILRVRSQGRTDTQRLGSLLHMARNTTERYGEFDPSGFVARREGITRQIWPDLPVADAPSERERLLKKLGEERTAQQDEEYEALRSGRLIGRVQHPEDVEVFESVQELEEELSRSEALAEREAYLLSIPSEKRSDEQAAELTAILAERVEKATLPEAKPEKSEFYQHLVDAGHIKDGEEIPEDPPEGWEPPQ